MVFNPGLVLTMLRATRPWPLNNGNLTKQTQIPHGHDFVLFATFTEQDSTQEKSLMARLANRMQSHKISKAYNDRLWNESSHQFWACKWCCWKTVCQRLLWDVCIQLFEKDCTEWLPKKCYWTWINSTAINNTDLSSERWCAWTTVGSP